MTTNKTIQGLETIREALVEFKTQDINYYEDIIENAIELLKINNEPKEF